MVSNCDGMNIEILLEVIVIRSKLLSGNSPRDTLTITETLRQIGIEPSTFQLLLLEILIIIDIIHTHQEHHT